MRVSRRLGSGCPNPFAFFAKDGNHEFLHNVFWVAGCPTLCPTTIAGVPPFAPPQLRVPHPSRPLRRVGTTTPAHEPNPSHSPKLASSCTSAHSPAAPMRSGFAVTYSGQAGGISRGLQLAYVHSSQTGQTLCNVSPRHFTILLAAGGAQLLFHGFHVPSPLSKPSLPALPILYRWRNHMSWTPQVRFRNNESAQPLSDQEVEKRLARAHVSNTARSIHQAKKRLAAGAAPYARIQTGRQLHAFPLHKHAKAVEISDPTLDRSDETAIAINPRNPRNIVAGAASFDGTQFINTAYVSKNGGHTGRRSPR